jgi:hypothetical protein
MTGLLLRSGGILFTGQAVAERPAKTKQPLLFRLFEFAVFVTRLRVRVIMFVYVRVDL